MDYTLYSVWFPLKESWCYFATQDKAEMFVSQFLNNQKNAIQQSKVTKEEFDSKTAKRKTTVRMRVMA